MEWVKTKLDDVLKYEQPTKYIVKSTRYNDNYKIPVLTAGKSFILGYTNETENIFTDVPVIIFDDFTTAFKFVDFPFKVKSSAMKILKADKNISDIKFLYYLMQTIKVDRDLHKRYWISKYSQFKIPLPPLKTQKKIATILDEADKLRQLNKTLIQKYEALTQSLFLDMFGDPVLNPKGWNIIKLQDASYIIMGQSPKGDTYNDKRIGTPLLNGPTEFGKKYPIERQWTTKPTKFCKKNDILFCVRGATAGKMNWADKEYCIGRGLAAIRSKGVFSDEYLYKILSNMYNIFQNTSNGSTFINITSNDLKNIKIPVTPLNLQNEFADRIKIIETQKQQAQEALEKANNLFNSLLQKAFKGELIK